MESADSPVADSTNSPASVVLAHSLVVVLALLTAVLTAAVADLMNLIFCSFERKLDLLECFVVLAEAQPWPAAKPAVPAYLFAAAVVVLVF